MKLKTIKACLKRVKKELKINRQVERLLLKDKKELKKQLE